MLTSWYVTPCRSKGLTSRTTTSSSPSTSTTYPAMASTHSRRDRQDGKRRVRPWPDRPSGRCENRDVSRCCGLGQPRVVGDQTGDVPAKEQSSRKVDGVQGSEIRRLQIRASSEDVGIDRDQGDPFENCGCTAHTA